MDSKSIATTKSQKRFPGWVLRPLAKYAIIEGLSNIKTG